MLLLGSCQQKANFDHRSSTVVQVLNAPSNGPNKPSKLISEFEPSPRLPLPAPRPVPLSEFGTSLIKLVKSNPDKYIIAGSYSILPDGGLALDKATIRIKLSEPIDIRNFSYYLAGKLKLIEDDYQRVFSIGDKPAKFLSYEFNRHKSRVWLGNGAKLYQPGISKFDGSNRAGILSLHSIRCDQEKITFESNGLITKEWAFPDRRSSQTDIFEISNLTGVIYDLCIGPATKGKEQAAHLEHYRKYFRQVALESGLLNGLDQWPLKPSKLTEWEIALLKQCRSFNYEVNPRTDKFKTPSSFQALAPHYHIYGALRGDHSKNHAILNAPAKYFEHPAVLKGVPHLFLAGKQGTTAPKAAFFARFNYEGNPLYNSRGLMARALSQVNYDMVFHNTQLFHSPGYFETFPYFAAGASYAWAYVIKEAETMGFDVRYQKEALFHFFSLVEPQSDNPEIIDQLNNINTKVIAGMCIAYTLLEEKDTETKEWLLKLMRKLMFGNSSISDPKKSLAAKGMYNPNGYIDEGNGPEVSYNGQSLFYLCTGYSFVRNQPQFDFLKEALIDMVFFRNMQAFSTPSKAYIGPSGYAGRTGGGWPEGDQGNTFSSNSVLAWLTGSTNWIAYMKGPQKRESYRHNEESIRKAMRLTDEAMNKRKVARVDPDSKPDKWAKGKEGFNNRTQWAAEVPFGISEWNPLDYAGLRQRNPSFPLKDFAVDIPGNFEYRTPDFYCQKEGSFFMFGEQLQDHGQYAPWTGGGYQGVWKEGVGPFILARHDKAGDEKNKGENTRVFEEIESWACNHVWGYDQKNQVFSTATERFKKVPANNTVITELAAANISINSRIDGQTIAITRKNELREMNLSIPILIDLRKNVPSPTTFEYRNEEGNFSPLNQTDGPILTREIRVTKNYQQGGKSYRGSVIFQFSEKAKLRLGPLWRQRSGGQSSNINLLIDLLSLKNDTFSYSFK
jgi:hypothetical protein